MRGYNRRNNRHTSRLLILSLLLAIIPGGATAEGHSASAVTDTIRIIGLDYTAPDQWVEIANQGTGSMNLTGWRLINSQNQTYSFPAGFSLEAGSVLRVHSSYGSNKGSDLFNSTLLWKQEGDTATLIDADGKIVSLYSYPVKVSSAGNRANIETVHLDDTSYISGPLQPFLPDYRSSNADGEGNAQPRTPVNMTGHPFICHGGPLNWAWTSGVR